MDASPIETIRSFNRLVTLRVGALNDSYLGRGRPLGEARLLFEIGAQGRASSELRETLGLDSGYFTRLLKSLERQGLVTVEPAADDRRRRRVSLTEKGKAEQAAYDALADDVARSMIDNLDEDQRKRLLAAMSEVQRLVTAAQMTLEVEPPDSEGARFCLEAYFAELAQSFEEGFQPDLGDAMHDTEMVPPSGCFVVVRLHGRPIACGGLKSVDEETAEIKRMWVSPDARGLGVASRLVKRLEEEARQRGKGRVILDTNRALTPAQTLYRKLGYRDIGRYNDNPYADFWFEKVLVE